MNLSSKTILSLKLLIDLGEHYNSKDYISLNDIAKRKEISKKFLEQIVPFFKSANLIIVNRGKDGGYRLNKRPSDISLKEIIYLTDNSFEKIYTNSQAIDIVLDELDKKIVLFLEKTTLQDLVDLEIQSYSNSYCI